jgi:hypothetical protein
MARPSRRVRQLLPLPESRWEDGTDNGADGIDWDTGDYQDPETGTDPNAELNIEGGQSVIHAHGTAGATETIDPTLGNVHSLTLDQDCTITLSAPVGTGAATLALWVTQDGTGGWDITWPGSVTEEGTHTTTASTTQRVILESIDGGTAWIATWIGAGGSAGTPATTVEDETTFGITPAVGTDTEYARQDHTHGSPNLETSGHWEVLMDGGSPPAALESGSGTDWLYVWVP